MRRADSLVARALRDWSAAADRAARPADCYADLDAIDLAIARWLGSDTPPPELADWPALTAAVDAEFAACDTALDVLTQSVIIRRRPRPCGHMAWEGYAPPLDCVYCVMLIDTVRVSRALRWVELRNDVVTERVTEPGSVTRIPGQNPESSQVRPRVVTEGSSTTGSSVTPQIPVACVTPDKSGPDLLAHLTRLTAGGPVDNTATGWGNLLGLTARQATTILRDDSRLAEYGLYAREDRESHTGRRLIRVGWAMVRHDRD